MQHANVSEGNFIIKKCFIFKIIVGILWSQKPLMFICKYNLTKFINQTYIISHTNFGHSWINKL